MSRTEDGDCTVKECTPFKGRKLQRKGSRRHETGKSVLKLNGAEKNLRKSGLGEGPTLSPDLGIVGKNGTEVTRSLTEIQRWTASVLQKPRTGKTCPTRSRRENISGILREVKEKKMGSFLGKWKENPK